MLICFSLVVRIVAGAGIALVLLGGLALIVGAFLAAATSGFGIACDKPRQLEEGATEKIDGGYGFVDEVHRWRGVACASGDRDGNGKIG